MPESAMAGQENSRKGRARWASQRLCRFESANTVTGVTAVCRGRPSVGVRSLFPLRISTEIMSMIELYLQHKVGGACQGLPRAPG